MLFNSELTLTFPEGFHEMTEEERAEMQFVADGPGKCISDPSKHILISIGWKRLGGLTRFMVSAKDIVNSMENIMHDVMAPYNYGFLGNEQKSVGGLAAKGIRFRYTTKDGLEMYGESYVAKHKRTLYYFHFYTWEALTEENCPVWAEILHSAAWA